MSATACSSSSPTGPASANPTSITISSSDLEPKHLNPILGFARDGASKIFDGLVSRDAALTPVPALAAELPTPSADGLSYTVTLREGVTFHDGTPLTSKDVAFTYRTLLDPATTTTVASHFAMIKSVETPDERTVVFRLHYPYAAFPERVTLGIVPEHAFAGLPVDKAAFNQSPIGTGPFKLAEWRRGDRLVLAANETYWGGAPAIKKVTFLFLGDDNARVARLSSGEIDGGILPPRLAKGTAERAGFRLHDLPSADFRAVSLPMENPVVADQTIRRALRVATNRQAMVDALLMGHGEPAHGALHPTHPWYEKSIEAAHDPEAAKTLLEEAGWRAGPDGIRVKDGSQARFTLLYSATDTLGRELALAFASDAKAVGIQLDLEGKTWDAIQPRLAHDAVVRGGGSPYDPDFHIYGMYHSSVAGKGWLNSGRWRNAETDALLDQGRASADPAVREQAYRELQRQQADDPALIHLVYLRHVYVLRDAWDGLETQVEPHDLGPLHGPWWNLERWRPKAG